MFNSQKKLVEKLEEDITRLRAENERLKNKNDELYLELLKSREIYTTQDTSVEKQPSHQEVMTYESLSKKIEEKPAESALEQQQKKLADKELESLFTGLTPRMHYDRA